jgi:DNA-binding MarR family transcriptional regulator
MVINERDSQITLSVLNVVEKNSHVTQRDVAKDIGIALGLTNTYLKRCIKKGLIKVQQVPANRYAYYLTPRGFSEKSRLTAEYLSQGFQYFRVAKIQLVEILGTCEDRGWKNVAFHGLTDITEIAVLCSSNYKVRIVGIIDASTSLKEYSGIPIFESIDELKIVEAIIITDLGDPQTSLKYLSGFYPESRIFMPQILNLSDKIRVEEAET